MSECFAVLEIIINFAISTWNNLLTFSLVANPNDVMEKYLEPSKDEIEMAFVASCIEDVANRLGENYLDVFERMDKVGMIDRYIYPCYETLHTESRENLTTSLIETLKRWENEDR